MLLILCSILSMKNVPGFVAPSWESLMTIWRSIIISMVGVARQRKSLCLVI